MPAESEPCMWGSATLVTLVSSTCMMTTIITVSVMAHRRAGDSGASVMVGSEGAEEGGQRVYLGGLQAHSEQGVVEQDDVVQGRRAAVVEERRPRGDAAQDRDLEGLNVDALAGHQRADR